MLRDIKSPFELLDPLFFLFIFILVMIAVLLTAWILKHRKKQQSVANTISQRPPEETAQERLDACIENYRKDGNVKVYYSEVSNTIRDYIGQRYAIDALEKTTSEIFLEMRKNRIDRKVALQFKEILSTCDLVKFAKLTPPEKEAEELYINSKQLLGETTPESEPAGATNSQSPKT